MEQAGADVQKMCDQKQDDACHKAYRLGGIVPKNGIARQGKEESQHDEGHIERPRTEKPDTGHKCQTAERNAGTIHPTARMQIARQEENRNKQGAEGHQETDGS